MSTTGGSEDLRAAIDAVADLASADDSVDFALAAAVQLFESTIEW